MTNAPCQWAVDPACGQEIWDAASQEARNRAADFATTVLWASTGRQFGLCTLTVRPCVDQWSGAMGGGYGMYWMDGTFMPYIWNGQWMNMACGCVNLCCCGAQPFTSVPLLGPVASVIEVKIDGVVLAPSAYRVDNSTALIRQDGGQWPICTNYNLAAGQVGTWTVTYCRGVPVPTPLVVAAGTLAVEFLKACSGAACRLPGRVVNVVRQGVAISMVDVADLLTHGFTGLQEVDLLVRSYNPSGLDHRLRVFSPDLQLPRVTTSP